MSAALKTRSITLLNLASQNTLQYNFEENWIIFAKILSSGKFYSFAGVDTRFPSRMETNIF